MKVASQLLLLIALMSVGSNLMGQELEPRRWSHLPSGVGFFGLGTAYTSGYIHFNPALRVEDTEVDTAAMVGGYIRSFDWFGKTARIDVTLPYAQSHWKGTVDGEYISQRRQGFGDARLRLSVNLIGAPALQGEEYARFRASNPVSTVVGAAIAITAPTGEYSNDRLLDLGSNRWIVRPQIGVLHQRHKWQFELTGSVFLFGDDEEFLDGLVREQDPFWFAQGHIIHTFRPGLWAAFSGGYGYGSRSTVAGVRLADKSRMRFFRVSMGVPINPRHGLSFGFAVGRSNTSYDYDLDRFSAAWSMMFGR